MATRVGFAQQDGSNQSDWAQARDQDSRQRKELKAVIEESTARSKRCEEINAEIAAMPPCKSARARAIRDSLFAEVDLLLDG